MNTLTPLYNQPNTDELDAVAEMADRVRANNWDDDLDEVLVQYPPSPPKPTPTPEATPIFLPLILKGW